MTLVRNAVRWFTHHAITPVQPTSRARDHQAAISFISSRDVPPSRRRSLNESAHKQRSGAR